MFYHVLGSYDWIEAIPVCNGCTRSRYICWDSWGYTPEGKEKSNVVSRRTKT